jgi:hypothetical protein
MLRVQVARLSNNRSLLDITYSEDMNMFSLQVVEYGEGGKGSKSKATYFLAIDDMSLLASDIFNLQLKFWDKNKIEFRGGLTKARFLQIEATKSNKGVPQFSFFVKEGEAVKNKFGGTTFKEGGTFDSASTWQSAQDVRKGMKSVLDFIQALSNQELHTKNFKRWTDVSYEQQEERPVQPQKPTPQKATVQVSAQTPFSSYNDDPFANISLGDKTPF